jgi:hypothetical protein
MNLTPSHRCANRFTIRAREKSQSHDFALLPLVPNFI